MRYIRQNIFDIYYSKALEIYFHDKKFYMSHIYFIFTRERTQDINWCHMCSLHVINSFLINNKHSLECVCNISSGCIRVLDPLKLTEHWFQLMLLLLHVLRTRHSRHRLCESTHACIQYLSIYIHRLVGSTRIQWLTWVNHFAPQIIRLPCVHLIEAFHTTPVTGWVSYNSLQRLCREAFRSIVASSIVLLSVMTWDCIDTLSYWYGVLENYKYTISSTFWQMMVWVIMDHQWFLEKTFWRLDLDFRGSIARSIDKLYSLRRFYFSHLRGYTQSGGRKKTIFQELFLERHFNLWTWKFLCS